MPDNWNLPNGQLLNQGNSWEYARNAAEREDCFGVKNCNFNNVIMQWDPTYYGYVNFFLLMLAIVVICPLLGWGWSTATRDKNYKPGGGYGVAGL